MEILLDFLMNNWKTIIFICFGIAEVLLLIFKRSTKVIEAPKEFILKTLPELIKQAETVFSDGAKKKTFVLAFMSRLLGKEFPRIDIDHYLDFISDSVEEILSTPNKKGE